MHRFVRRNAALAIVFLCLAASSIRAQGIVTTETVQIGGPGAVGCQGTNDPPTLDDGTLAEALLTYVYDNMSGILTLTVENTSPIIPGEPNPLLSRINFNLPAGVAVTNLVLLSQTAAGGAPPNFQIAVDLDILDANNTIQAGCLGDFNVVIEAPGPGGTGALKNAAATQTALPGSSLVTGPIVFTFQLTSANLESMTAQAFASAFSQNAAGPQANAAGTFSLGGPGAMGSGIIGDAMIDCEPSGTVVGSPNLGANVFFIQSGAPGCVGLIFGSFNPGPSMFNLPPGFSAGGGTESSILVVPVGTPGLALSSGIQPNTATIMNDQGIPNDPMLVGMKIFFATVLLDPQQMRISSSDQFQLTILM